MKMIRFINVYNLDSLLQDSTTIGWKALALFDVSMTFVYVALQCLRTEKSLESDFHQVQIVAR